MMLMRMLVNVFDDARTCFDPCFHCRVMPDPTCDNMFHVVLFSKRSTRVMTWGLVVAID